MDLDCPINAYLGETKLVSHLSDSAQATVRQVLLHTAGLPMHHNIFFGENVEGRPHQDESIRRYGMIANDPGQEFTYSNFGYGLLDSVITRASGKSYAEFMREEVFAPLGLTHTSVLLNPGLAEHTAHLYDDQGNMLPPMDFDHRGASAVHSSIHDLIRYGMFHLQSDVPGQKQILSAEMLETMHRPSRFALPGSGVVESHVGLGWGVVDLEGVRMLVSSGGLLGEIARLALVPEEKVAVAIATSGDVTGDRFPLGDGMGNTLVPNSELSR